MKSMIFVALALVAVAAALPVEQQVPQIVRSSNEQQPDGGYIYQLETDDGTQREEQGALKEVLDEENKPHAVVVVRGSYSYINPDGKTESIRYVADENGFQPEGDSIPKPASR